MTSQKQQVLDLLKAIETGATGPVAAINPDKYIQHNLAAEDGLAGFQALLQAVPRPAAHLRTARVFQDGDFVFAHTEYHVFGPSIGFDIFRFESGKIVEHWDNLQPTAGPNPSGHTMIDGPTEPKDIEKTEANKALAKSFLEDLLMEGRTESLVRYFDGDRYIQHHPQIADGASNLLAAFKAMADAGIVAKYDRIHQVLGEGNFVLVVSESHFDGKPTSFYDLIRVENGKIAEHWDTVEIIPPRAEWKNDNGKF